MAAAVRQHGCACDLALSRRPRSGQRAGARRLGLPARLRAGGQSVRVLARRVRLGGAATRPDLGDPAVDRRVFAQERRAEPRADPGDPVPGRITADGADGASGDHAVFTRSDGTPGRIERRVDMLEEAPVDLGDGLVLQVSRWDRLKDPIGVLGAFVERVCDSSAGAPDAGRPVHGSGRRRSRGRTGVRRGARRMARVARSGAPASTPGVAADGRHRGERRGRQRAATERAASCSRRAWPRASA